MINKIKEKKFLKKLIRYNNTAERTKKRQQFIIKKLTKTRDLLKSKTQDACFSIRDFLIKKEKK